MPVFEGWQLKNTISSGFRNVIHFERRVQIFWRLPFKRSEPSKRDAGFGRATVIMQDVNLQSMLCPSQKSTIPHFKYGTAPKFQTKLYPSFISINSSPSTSLRYPRFVVRIKLQLQNKVFYSVAVDHRNACPCGEDKKTCSLMHSWQCGKNEHAT